MEEQIIAYFDLFGTVIFAITGALRGIKKELDFLGVVVLACTVGVGGGITAESELEFEYDETWQKAKAVVAAIAGGDVHE